VLLRDQPLANVPVSLWAKGAADERKTATDLNGAFSIYGVAPGHYVLQVGDQPISVPSPPSLQVQLNVDRRLSLILPLDFNPCGHSSYFLSLDPSGEELTALLGHVTNEDRVPVGGAAVNLYVPSLGRIETTQTDVEGMFSFSHLAVRKDYWVQVLSNGYYVGEFTKLDLRQGYESIYHGLTLNPCQTLHCEPYLRKVQIHPYCEQ
jgi:hypothetical protein